MFFSLSGWLAQDSAIPRPRAVGVGVRHALEEAETELRQPSHRQLARVFSRWQQGRGGDAVDCVSGKKYHFGECFYTRAWLCGLSKPLEHVLLFGLIFYGLT